MSVLSLIIYFEWLHYFDNIESTVSSTYIFTYREALLISKLKVVNILEIAIFLWDLVEAVYILFNGHYNAHHFKQNHESINRFTKCVLTHKLDTKSVVLTFKKVKFRVVIKYGIFNKSPKHTP